MATGTIAALKQRVGWLAYADPISRSVVGNKRFPMHYRVDRARERSVHAHTVIVGNCGTLTAGILLLPDATVDDGLLDVVLLRPEGFWQWVRVGWRLTIGGILHRSRAGRVVLQSAPRRVPWNTCKVRGLRRASSRRSTSSSTATDSVR